MLSEKLQFVYDCNATQRATVAREIYFREINFIGATRSSVKSGIKISGRQTRVSKCWVLCRT